MKSSPIDFGDTPLTTYEKRHFRSLRVVEASGMRIKVTSIRCQDEPLSTELHQKAESFLSAHLPDAAKAEGDHHGLGFAVVHEGVHATWLLMHWWAHGEICCQELAAAVGDGEFATIAVPFHACVWENVVVNHEHHAWVRTMLNGSPDPDKYLHDVLPQGEY